MASSGTVRSITTILWVEMRRLMNHDYDLGIYVGHMKGAFEWQFKTLVASSVQPLEKNLHFRILYRLLKTKLQNNVPVHGHSLEVTFGVGVECLKSIPRIWKLSASLRHRSARFVHRVLPAPICLSCPPSSLPTIETETQTYITRESSPYRCNPLLATKWLPPTPRPRFRPSESERANQCSHASKPTLYAGT